jgi:preprotein translocase subunit SecY
MNRIIKAILTIPDLRSKFLFTLFILFVYRIGSHIPISGVDINGIEALFSKGGVLGFFNLFSGGSLSRFSVFGLGILPYINASIIIQLSTIIFPKLKEMQEEGESGRKQLSQYTRYLAIAIAFLQAAVMTLGFRQYVLPDISFVFFFVFSVLSLVAGSALVMWFGEVITEFGIGNGASLLIFVGIVGQMPTYFSNTYILIAGGGSVLGVILLFLVFAFMIFAIVYVQEAQRRIPIHYAKRASGQRVSVGNRTYLPLKLIQGGVMPIIFASAILQFPLMISQYIHMEWIKNALAYDGWIYNSLFCAMIFFFTYFYTAVTFNPQDISDNIKKQGGFIPGVRPGTATVEYLDGIVSKLTLVGAFFLSVLSLFPTLTAKVTHVTSFVGLGGTALLIIVGVALDLIRQIDTFVISNQYEGWKPGDA